MIFSQSRKGTSSLTLYVTLLVLSFSRPWSTYLLLTQCPHASLAFTFYLSLGVGSLLVTDLSCVLSSSIPLAPPFLRCPLLRRLILRSGVFFFLSDTKDVDATSTFATKLFAPHHSPCLGSAIIHLPSRPGSGRTWLSFVWQVEKARLLFLTPPRR
jgi:hypothetical protein